MATKIPSTDQAILEPALRSKLSSRAINLSLITNLILAILKVSVGILAHSSALLADGINSSSDVIYNAVVSIFIRAAKKPADDEHPYGHSQFESVGALIVSAFIITAAFTIFWTSVQSLVEYLQGNSEFSSSSHFALYAALFTVGLKTVLYFYTRGLGKKTNNPSVMAITLDHRNDICSASAVVAGTLMTQLGYPWADPLAGAVVAIVFLLSGIEILRDTVDILMDTVPGKALDNEIRQLLQDIPGLEDIEKIQAHRFGQYLVINLTIFVASNISVNEGDRIADNVETKLLDNVDYIRAVHVHFHPKPGS